MSAAEFSGPSLLVRDLRKSFGDLVAVDGIDLEVRPGECLGLLGPNGAGKTTTIEICEGLTKADAGVVEVLGMRWETSARALRQRIGVQLQETQLSERLTVEETVQLFRSFYHRGPATPELIDLVRLADKRRARVGLLSGGQRQRLAMACALAGDPDLLFLDEPTTGLDPQSRRQLWDLVEDLKRMGRTVILTTHYMDEAQQLSDRIAVMDHGRIIATGTPRDLVSSLGAAHIVQFTPAEGSPPIDVEMLRSLSGVLDARCIQRQFRLSVERLHVSVPELFRYFVAQRIELAELSTHSATLEDVFMNLTGRHLRDA